MTTSQKSAYAAVGVFLFLAVSQAADSPYLYLKMYRHDAERLADHALGYVSANPAKPLPSNGKGLFYVRVLGDLPAFTVERLVDVVAKRQLTGIDLSEQSGFDDRNCAALAGLSQLTYLGLSGTAVTDAGLGALEKMRGLQVVGLGARSTDAALETISHWTQLVILNLSLTSVSDAGLARLVHLPLRRLELGPAVTDAGLKALAPLRKLRHLDLGQTRVSDKGIMELAAFPHLETLLAGPQLTSAGFLDLTQLPALHRSLRRLDLSNTGVNDRMLGALALFENLEELALSGTVVTDTGIRRLAKLQRLRALELSNTQMSGAGLADIAKLENLEVLSISLSERLTAGDLRAINHMKKLRLLIVNGNPIVGKQLSQVMTKLRDMELAPAGRSGARQNTIDFIAQLGPARPTMGLHRLHDDAPSATLPADGSGFNQAHSG